MIPLAPLETAPAVLPTETPTAVEVAPKAKSSRYQSLDLWRGAACLMLVLYHTTFFVSGELRPWDVSTWSIGSAAIKFATLMWIGVPIFFVVSGYCIAASVESLNRRPYSLKTYFLRRFRRIYPPLWIACVYGVVFTLTIAIPWPSVHEACPPLPRFGDWTIWNWLGNATATESWHHHASGEKHYLMNNTWTLCYEEQFYAVVGVFLLLAARRLVTASIVMGVLTLACRHVARYQGLDQSGWFFDGHWLLFAAGILLHYQLTSASRAQWWAILGLFVLGMAYAVIDRKLMAGHDHARHFDEYIFIACAFAIALIGLRSWDGALMNSRWLQPFAWCGKRSYSIYLTHFPAVVTLGCVMALLGFTTPTQWLLVTLPLCIAVALALGWAFHLLVERHFVNAPA